MLFLNPDSRSYSSEESATCPTSESELSTVPSDREDSGILDTVRVVTSTPHEKVSCPHSINQVDLSAVSERKRRLIRETQTDIFYFTSMGSGRIRSPPPIPRDHGVEVDDLYIHVNQAHNQAWQCKSIEPKIVWSPLDEQKAQITQDGQVRHFRITATGLPSWVVPSTLQKYRRQENNLQDGRADQRSSKQAREEKSGRAVDLEPKGGNDKAVRTGT